MTIKTVNVCIIICHPFPKVEGGEERFLEHYYHFLTRNDIKFTVMSSISKTKNKNILGIGIEKFRLPLVGFTPYFLLFTLISVIRIIQKNKHQSFYLIHSMDTGYAGLAGLFVSKILRKKFLVHSHCVRSPLLYQILLHREGLSSHFISVFEKFERSIDTIVSRNADLIIAVSKEIKQYLSELIISPDKITIIPVGIKVSTFQYPKNHRNKIRLELGIPENAFVIGYIGRLETPNKRLKTLIKAFNILHSQFSFNSYLLIVGNGCHMKIKKEINDLGISSIIFTGFRKDIDRILLALDVFVLPSLSEGCPISLLEAMAAGKAIIASDIPSIRDIVVDGKEALLFDPKNLNALVSALKKLEFHENYRKKLGKNAKIRAKNFEIDYINNIILSTYQKILN